MTLWWSPATKLFFQRRKCVKMTGSSLWSFWNPCQINGVEDDQSCGWLQVKERDSVGRRRIYNTNLGAPLPDSAIPFKNMASTFTDLPMDVSNQIISAVAELQDGAQIVAQSMPFSQHFLEATNNNAVLRAVCFQNVRILGRAHLFQSTNGLLYKCAKVGNPTAVHLLAQVIIATSAQLLKINMKKEKLKCFHGFKPKYKNGRGKARKDAVVASFMANFTPEPGSKITNSDPLVLSFHWEFVRAFILKCTPHEIIQIKPCIYAYLKLFAGDVHQVFSFWCWFRTMCTVAKASENERLIQLDHRGREFMTRVNPPPYGRVTDLSHVGSLFEKLRALALEKFEDIIPKLN